MNLCTAACPGDADGDIMAGFGDNAAVDMLRAETVPPAPLEVDLDGLGDIDPGDAALILTNRGTTRQ